ARQPLERMAGSARRAKLLRPGFAVHVETDFESVAVQTKDTEVAIARFRACDEIDVDLVRVRFDTREPDAPTDHKPQSSDAKTREAAQRESIHTDSAAERLRAPAGPTARNVMSRKTVTPAGSSATS